MNEQPRLYLVARNDDAGLRLMGMKERRAEETPIVGRVTAQDAAIRR